MRSPDGSVWKRITKEGHYYGTSSWSPDGHWMVYTRTDSRDVDQLFILDITGARITQLTSDPSYKFSPAWSPGGQWIVYAESQDPYEPSDLYIINRYGGERKVLANSEFDESLPVWSPDGERIAYLYTPEKVEAGMWSKIELNLMNPDDSHKRKILVM